MDPFAPADAGFDASLPGLAVDVYTDAYRISGTVRTRHARVAEIVNQLPSTHLPIEQATLSAYADPGGTLGAPRALVRVDEILLVVAPQASGAAAPEMRVQKRAVGALIALPPFRVIGEVHVPDASRPEDGILNYHERFMPITRATITSGLHPELERRAEAVAVRRDRAHVILVADDLDAAQLLARVVDEGTAAQWMRRRDEEEG